MLHVVLQGFVDYMRALRHFGVEAAYVLLRVLAQAPTAEPDLASLRIPEAQDQVCQRALAGSRRPDYRHLTSRLQGEGHIFEREGVALPVAEAHVIEP